MKNRLLAHRGKIFFGISLLLVILIANIAYFRFDTSTGSLFSLSKGSKNIASNLVSPIKIDLYYSESHPDLTAQYRAFCSRVIELLKEFTKYSSGKIQLDIIDPKLDSDDEVQARRAGIIPIPVGQNLYFGAVLSSADQTVVLENIDPNKEEFIEFDLAEAVLSVTSTNKKQIALYSDLDVFGGTQQNHEEWVAIKNLNKSFDIQRIDLKSPIDPNYSVVAVFYPLNLSEQQEYFLDQYLVNGGKAFIAFDAFSRSKHSRDRRSLLQQSKSKANQILPNLFQKWGIVFDNQLMVGDLELAQQIKSINRSFHYPFFIEMTAENLNRNHPITGNLHKIVLAEPGSFSLASESSELKIDVLLETSLKSGTHSIEMAKFLSPSDLTSRFKSDHTKRILGAILDGPFYSAFEENPSPDENHPHKHLKSSSQNGVVILVSDIDFIDDTYSIEKIPFYNRTILKPKNDNQSLLLNSMEFLAGNQNLLAIRKGGLIKRSFSLLEQIESESKAQYQEEEATISSEIKMLQNQIQRISQENSGLLTLNSDQKSKLRELREQEAQLRLSRREVRNKLHARANNIKKNIILLNFSVPLLAIFIAFLWARRWQNSKSA